MNFIWAFLNDSVLTPYYDSNYYLIYYYIYYVNNYKCLSMSLFLKGIRRNPKLWPKI